MMWEMVKLETIAEIIAGQSPDSIYYNKNGEGVPFFQGKADFGDDYPTVRYYCTVPTKMAKPLDILLSVRAPVGPTNICDKDACIGRGLAAIRCKKGLDHKFLYFYLKSIEQKLAASGNGSTFSAITTSVIKEIEIPLPPLSIQQRIAAILDKADALRRKDQALLKKYDALAQAIFINMFGDPIKNERGWEVRKLGQMGNLDRGISKHRPRNEPSLLGGIYPLVQTGDVANSGGIIKTYKSTYSELGLKQSKLWSKGTLCITIAANIAKTGVLDFNACFPDSIVGFIPKKNETNTLFIQHWLSFLQKMLEDTAPESAQKNINLEMLRNLDVINPPFEEQESFRNRIELVLKLRDNCLELQKKSESLFQSLLHQAFKGDLG